MREAPFAAKADAKANQLPLISLITFSPLGNPLSSLSAGQRNLFFEYLLLSLHNQRTEQAERVAALNKRIVLPASLSAAALSMNSPSSAQKTRQAHAGDEMKKTYMFSSVDIENFKNDLKTKGIAQHLDENNTEKINAMEKGSKTDLELGGNTYVVEKTGQGALNLHKKTEEKKAQEEKIADDGAKSTDLLSYDQKIRLEQFGEEMKKTGEKTAQQEKIAIEGAKRKKDERGAAGADGAPVLGAGGMATKAAEETAGATGVAGWKFSSLFKKHDEEKKGGENGSPSSSSPSASGQKNMQDGPSLSTFSSTYGRKAGVVSGAIEQMVIVIDDYARGNAETERKVVGNLHESMRASNYRADDLMASLLLVIEDDAWSGEESGLGSTKPHGGATRLAAIVPQKLRSTAQDSAVVRLASVREMLRYYFRLHPQDYSVALASALGITSDQEEDSTFLQERLAFELASIGSFALAQKLLAEVKKKKELDAKKELDTAECLMELGYIYDSKKKRLILGKRTCGKLAEARAIIGLLLASARKKK